MDKKEFLNTLRSQLIQEVSPDEVEDNIRYYDDYIQEALRDGKTEQQTLEELGSPFLIARTIIDTFQSGNKNVYHTQGTQTSHYGTGEEKNQEDSWNTQKSFQSFKISKGSKWAIIGALAVAVIVILSILGSAIALLSRFFVPIVVILIIIYIVKGKNRR